MPSERNRIHAMDERVLAGLRERKQPTPPTDRAAAEAELRWNAAGPPDPNHGFLRAHDIAPDGARQDGGHLLYPVTDTADNLRALWAIGEDGSGRPTPGARDPATDKRTMTPEIRGHHSVVRGDPAKAGRVYLATSPADAATCATAAADINAAHLAALTPENLAPAAAAIRQARPDARIIILATEADAEHARAAAEATGAVAILPSIPPRHAPPESAGPVTWSALRRLIDAEQGDGAAELRRQLAAADTACRPPAAAPPPADDDADLAEVRQLAELSPFDYDRQRKAAADRLGVTLQTLDREVKRARAARAAAERPPLVETLDPWPEPVDARSILADIGALLSRHVVLPDGAADAIALWVLLTFCFNSFRICPKLLITSPEKRCGKSTLLELLAALVARALPTSNINPAGIFRTIEIAAHSVLIDEGDTKFKDNPELNGIVNSGHTRNLAFVIRVEAHEVTGQREPMKFSTWAPMVIAMIKEPVDTIVDRSVVLRLRRKLPGETTEKLGLDLFDTAAPLRRRLLRWGQDHADALQHARPDLPQHPNDRALDNWTPLFAIAEAIGGEWPARARASFAALTPTDTDDESIGPMILTDIRRAFAEDGYDRMHTADLIAALIAFDDRPWAEWRRGKPITGSSLAKMLQPFGIKVRQVWHPYKKSNGQGYLLDQFADAFARYLAPPAGPTKGVL
jgi:putative DNA primase/helicase